MAQTRPGPARVATLLTYFTYLLYLLTYGNTSQARPGSDPCLVFEDEIEIIEIVEIADN